MNTSHSIQCSKGNHSALSVDDMGDGVLVLSSDEGSVSLSIDQLHAAVVALSPRYPVAN